MRPARIGLVLLCALLATTSASGTQAQALPESTDVFQGEFVQPNLGAKLDRMLTTFSKYGFSGTVTVGWGGLLALHKAYGLADREQEIPCTVRTAFAIGPLTMQFTAAAILDLEARGLLHTEDPISAHLGAFPGEKSRATIHHLLSHSAGLAADENRCLRGDLEECLASIKEAEIDFAPGTDRRQSRAGYILLAAIVEKASGQSFESYLTERLFLPAAMNSTRFEGDPQRASSPLAVGYEGGRSILPLLGRLPVPRHVVSIFRSWIGKRSERLRPVSESPYDWTRRGASGIVTTAADLFRWEVALRGEKILSAAAKRKLNGGMPAIEAYGWQVDKTKQGTDRFRQGGAADGYESAFVRYGQYLRYVQQELTVIVLVNNDMGWARPVWSSIEDVSYGEDYSLPFALLCVLLTLLFVGGATRQTRRKPRGRRRRRIHSPL